jgi:acyl-coenzyme A thioesterase PaaI-like protein
MSIQLPRTLACLVCGRENPHGLQLQLQVDRQNGVVSTPFTPDHYHSGFEGIVHGGILATVIDEAMVWAATWRARRFCVCGEFTVRFRQNAVVGQPLMVTAAVESARSRMIQAAALVMDVDRQVIATASGKYVPMSPDRSALFVATLIEEPATAEALRFLRQQGE